jgi:hypothetical protein
MKAKLFKIIPILLQKSTVNPEEFTLQEKIEVSADKYLGNLKIKLPEFLLKLLSQKLVIKNINWSKQKTTIETELNLEPIFEKVDDFIQFDNASLIIKTDSNSAVVSIV